ncbi:C-terminal binding protein [Pelagibacterium sp.]|uniref:C-terminal binding protein n=1 Tax=Pelagibacterium sp. TaxID=1967288 RepID=UPI003BACAFE4
MQRRVVITDYTFPDIDRETAAAEAAGCSLQAHQCRTAEEVAEAVAGADMAIVQFAPLDKAAIAGMADRPALVRYGIGYDNIDVTAARELGATVGYVPDYCTDEVAEHTCASLLTLLRKLPALDGSVRAGRWAAVAAAKPILPFQKTTVGFFGFGQIGRAVHSRLKGFGFAFAVADPALSQTEAQQLGLERLSADELFRRSDAICLHAPATAETKSFVNAERLSGMRPNAVLVNPARGALIDEQALADALGRGLIAGAALDVFETEPLPEASPLRDAPNLLLTPHAAWYSEEAIGRLQALVAEDISNHFAGKGLRKPVPA